MVSVEILLFRFPEAFRMHHSFNIHFTKYRNNAVARQNDHLSPLWLGEGQISRGRHEAKAPDG